MEFHFCRPFRLRPKMKNVFRSASSIHHKKVLVLVLVLKKVLITSLIIRVYMVVCGGGNTSHTDPPMQGARVPQTKTHLLNIFLTRNSGPVPIYERS